MYQVSFLTTVSGGKTLEASLASSGSLSLFVKATKTVCGSTVRGVTAPGQANLYVGRVGGGGVV